MDAPTVTERGLPALPATECRGGSAATRFAAARDAVRQERRRTTDERAAFETFRQRVAAVEPDRATTTDRSRALVAGPTATSADAVEEAYAATVMAVSHYESAYGEPYRESVAAEFGPELAAALDSGFDARTKRATVAAAERARDGRDAFVDVLDEEAASLATAEATAERVRDELSELTAEASEATRYGTLDAIRARLGVLADHCDEAATDRQADVDASRDAFEPRDDYPDVQRYLYRSLDDAYPALAVLAELGTAVRAARRRTERRLASVD